jgi:hypothetical protein
MHRHGGTFHEHTGTVMSDASECVIPRESKCAILFFLEIRTTVNISVICGPPFGLIQNAAACRHGCRSRSRRSATRGCRCICIAERSQGRGRGIGSYWRTAASAVGTACVRVEEPVRALVERPACACACRLQAGGRQSRNCRGSLEGSPQIRREDWMVRNVS